ncbi:MAG TPA: hypothetical protein PLZ50_06135, partial [Rubrivivax sp.]|nr:hypothetical protein [Rubrivivax sp.]
MTSRRRFVAAAASWPAAWPGAAGASAARTPTARPAPLRARRLQPGDTIALVAPSGAVYPREP